MTPAAMLVGSARLAWVSRTEHDGHRAWRSYANGVPHSTCRSAHDAGQLGVVYSYCRLRGPLRYTAFSFATGDWDAR